MFDINLTKAAIKQTEEAQDLNRQLSRLMCDIADGRGFMIMNGATTVSVVARQDGEKKVIKVYPCTFLQAKRYTQDDAIMRMQALPDPSQYRVVRIREALKCQGEALNAYMGELSGFLHSASDASGMVVSS
ncbi:MAG: hypothetical protein ACRCXB_23460 [Aeromonadaceae bacterium]